ERFALLAAGQGYEGDRVAEGDGPLGHVERAFEIPRLAGPGRATVSVGAASVMVLGRDPPGAADEEKVALHGDRPAEEATVAPVLRTGAGVGPVDAEVFEDDRGLLRGRGGSEEHDEGEKAEGITHGFGG